MERWILTQSGKRLDILEPRPSQIGDDREIATSLSRRFRFAGQTSYTVAQHCVEGAMRFERKGERRRALAFLLHELGEVYLPDIPTPLKSEVRVQTHDGSVPWAALELRHEAAILRALGCSNAVSRLIHSAAIKHMDALLLATEARAFLPPPPAAHSFGPKSFSSLLFSAPLTSDQAAYEFSKALERLR